MKKTKDIALCGIICAISIAICFIGSLFTFTEFISPIIAGFILIVVIECIGTKQAIFVYVSVALILLIIISKKTSAISYTVLFGCYPIIYSALEKCKSKTINIFVKMFVFLSIGAITILIALGFMPSIQERDDFKNLLIVGIVLYFVFVTIYELFMKVLFIQFRIHLKTRFDKFIK